MSFGLHFIAAVMIWFFDRNTSHLVLYSLVLFLAKSGAELAFGFVFVIHIDLFPTNFLVTSYGICNIFCRLITMFAPIVAEIPNVSIPLTFLVGLNLAGVIASIMLRAKSPLQNENTKDPQKEALVP